MARSHAAGVIAELAAKIPRQRLNGVVRIGTPARADPVEQRIASLSPPLDAARASSYFRIRNSVFQIGQPA
jgi:hypothetical protein